MPRIHPQHTYTLHGITGHGRTKADAKTDANDQIRDALTGSHAPRLLRWEGHTALIWRELGSWHVRRITATTPAGPLVACSSVASEQRAIETAEWMLAEDAMPDGIPAGPTPEILSSREARIEWQRQVQFHARFKAAQAAGMTHEQAHAWACEGPEFTCFDNPPRLEPRA